MKDATPHAWRNQMVWGLVIIAAGVAFLLERTGHADILDLWHYFPLLLAIAGLSNLVPPTTTRLVMSGLSCLGFALWLYVSLERLWGLGFHNSWPILIITWGVQVLLKPVLGSIIPGLSCFTKHCTEPTNPNGWI